MKPRVQVLYERGEDGLPYGSSYLRLLLPLSYPGVDEHVHVTFCPAPVAEAEIVLVDRLWHSRVTLAEAESLLARIHAGGARFVYAVDDDFRQLSTQVHTALPADYREVAALFLSEADAVLVTTSVLATRLQERCPHVFLVPNALDERLIVPVRPSGHTGDRELVLGYMGTRTHDEDLLWLVPALERAQRAHAFPMQLQIIGGCRDPEVRSRLQALPMRVCWLEPPSPLYPSFLTWFTGSVGWDLALAPLAENAFNQAKSDIKYLDYSALGVAGIYSRSLPAYRESVTHRTNGWLAEASTDSWAEAITALAADPELRQELATNGRRHLHAERILARRAMDMVHALESVWYG